MIKFNLKSLTRAFVKMDVAIFIFIFLTYGSIIGTIIQQNQELETYQAQYGLFLADIVKILNFDGAYFSAWYLFFLALLMISLFFCLIINGKTIYKQIFKPVSINKLSELQEKSEKHEFKSQELALNELKTQGFKLEDLNSYKQVALQKNKILQIAYKNKALSKIGYFATHIGVLGLCIAGIVNGFFGFRADIDLAEGKQTSKAIIFKSEDERYLVKLPFIIKSNNFEVSRYSSNVVSEYTTSIEILDKQTKKSITKHELKVNSPLFINSFGLYQSSFYENVKAVNFNIFDLNSKKESKYSIKLSEKTQIKDTDFYIDILSFNKHTMLPINNSDIRYTEQDFGPSIEYRISSESSMNAVFRTYQSHSDLLGIGFFDETGNLAFQTIPVALVNNDLSMMELFSDMLNPKKHDQFKTNIAKHVAKLSKEEKIEYISKLIHAEKVYSNIDSRFIISLNNVEYDEVSGIQVNYDPSARIFFIASLLLCLGVIFMLYFRLKKAFIIQVNNKVFVYII